jgi:hypothetical protein
MGHARCDRAVRLLHQASSSNRAGAGSRGWTTPVQDTQRVSHSQGHTRRHQFQPGIITEPLGSLTVILAVIPPAATRQSGTHWLDEPPDVSSENRPGWHLLDGCVSTRNRKVEGSNPSSGSKTAGQRAFPGLLTGQRQPAVIPWSVIAS